MSLSLDTEAVLDELLSRPTAADIEAISQLDGDLMVIGATGKMGPTLVLRARRAVEACGSKTRVIAVSRSAQGSDSIATDLTDRKQVDALPDARYIIHMTGRKFGSTGNEPLTWAVNVWAPALVAERYPQAKIVTFSTGNVYPLVAVESGGATEQTAPAPVGEYAQSALARERMFEYFSNTRGTGVAILRLNYAIDLRYGVLLDIGTKVFERRAVDLAMGYVNVIWQGDANSICLRSFGLASSPARVLNLTGPETLSVRWIASRFGAHFGVEPVFSGQEEPTALLNNAAECWRIFGRPSVGPDEMIQMVANWIHAGGTTFNKPTHFEARDGAF
jgi:nucleoside-diphosphate-sugar epimerase